MSNVVPNSFVVLSDFHAMDWPIEKIVDHYLNEYDKIYILGDACDRGVDKHGRNSFNVLNQIYELTQQCPGKIIYVPGNHDQMLYSAVNGDEYFRDHLISNGGRDTYETYENRYSAYSEIPAQRIERLVEWIGEQPIQAVHNYNGQKYVLAHAFFNQSLYDISPNFCFRDYVNLTSVVFSFPANSRERDWYSKILNDAMDVLWFRKNDGNYNSDDLPKDNSIMVIGHTPEHLRQGTNLNLVNSYGKEISVHCVDGGVAYTGNMLKYDGGYGPINTIMKAHRDTSPKLSVGEKVTGEEAAKYFSYVYGDEGKSILNDVIIGTLRSRNVTPFEAYNNMNKFMTSLDINLIPDDLDLRDKAREIAPYIGSIVFEHTTKGKNENWYDGALKEYVDEVAVDHIFASTAMRFNSIKSATDALYGVFRDNRLDYITESVGNARTVAYGMGIENMRNVFRRSGCKNVSEYVEKKFGAVALQK